MSHTVILQRSTDKGKTWSEYDRRQHRWLSHAVRDAYSGIDYAALCEAISRPESKRKQHLYRVVDNSGKPIPRLKAKDKFAKKEK